MLPDWAGQYVGLPYAVGGREPATGLDCWGLVRLVWREQFGFHAPEHADAVWHSIEATNEVGRYIRREMEAYEQIEVGEERAGDAIIIRMRGAPLHVGIVVYPGYMLHVAEGADAVIEEYRRLAWFRRVVGFCRPGKSAKH